MSAALICQQNDAFRRGLATVAGLVFPTSPGRVVMTRGVAALAPETIAAILHAVATFDAFNSGNDPHKEHDFGYFELGGERVNWKIDYYADAAMEYGAEDPAVACHRVLTIMLAEEY